MNYVHGAWCPPVVKVRREKPGKPATPIFQWKDSDGWHTGDELPEHIIRAQPIPEREVCENHRISRIGDRRAA